MLVVSDVGAARLVHQLVQHVLNNQVRYHKSHTWKLNGSQIIAAVHFALHSPLLDDFCSVFAYDQDRIRRKILDLYLPLVGRNVYLLPSQERVRCARCAAIFYGSDYAELDAASGARSSAPSRPRPSTSPSSKPTARKS